MKALANQKKFLYNYIITIQILTMSRDKTKKAKNRKSPKFSSAKNSHYSYGIRDGEYNEKVVDRNYSLKTRLQHKLTYIVQDSAHANKSSHSSRI